MRLVYFIWVGALVAIFHPVPVECWQRRCAYGDLPLMLSLVFGLGLLPFGLVALSTRNSGSRMEKAALPAALAVHGIICLAGVFKYLPYLMLWTFQVLR